MRSSFLKSKLGVFIIIFLVFIGAMITYSALNTPSTPSPSTSKVLLMTSMGNITIELYNDMPITTGNFKNLTERGIYDGTIFHRVIDGFMIQGGRSNFSIPNIPDEFTDHNRNENGTVAMANAGPNTGNSQFFINLVNNSEERSYMDSDYPVFGRVIEGMDVVLAIGKVDTYKPPEVSEDSPLLDMPKQEVKITKAILLP